MCLRSAQIVVTSARQFVHVLATFFYGQNFKLALVFVVVRVASGTQECRRRTVLSLDYNSILLITMQLYLHTCFCVLLKLLNFVLSTVTVETRKTYTVDISRCF